MLDHRVVAAVEFRGCCDECDVSWVNSYCCGVAEESRRSEDIVYRLLRVVEVYLMMLAFWVVLGDVCGGLRERRCVRLVVRGFRLSAAPTPAPPARLRPNPHRAPLLRRRPLCSLRERDRPLYAPSVTSCHAFVFRAHAAISACPVSLARLRGGPEVRRRGGGHPSGGRSGTSPTAATATPW